MVASNLRCILAAGVAGIALASGSGASAQENTQLNEVVVEGGQANAEDASGVGPVNGVVAKVTTDGLQDPHRNRREFPQSVSVVGRTEMDDQGAQKIDEALRYTAGVFAQPFGADSDTNWLYHPRLRRDPDRRLHGWTAAVRPRLRRLLFDQFNLERIEVLKGPASVCMVAPIPAAWSTMSANARIRAQALCRDRHKRCGQRLSRLRYRRRGQ